MISPRVLTLRWLPVLFLGLTVLGGAAFANDEDVTVDGECNYDADANRTTCKYTIYGGWYYGLTVFFPIPATCVECVEITSDCMCFEGPQQWNGLFGFKSCPFDLPPGCVVTFHVTYDGQQYDGNQYQTARLEVDGGLVGEFDVPAMEVCAWEPWCQFAFDATEMNWAVRKPGYYAAQWANATLESNVAMSVQFEGFEDLVDPSGAEIAVWHAVGDVGAPSPPQAWLSPTEFNAQTLMVDAGTEILSFNLWTRVQTTVETSVGEYQNAAVITLVLENNQPYIDLAIKSDEQERRAPNPLHLGERRIIR